MTSWIISDLHLSAQRPAVTRAFLHWLQTTVANTEALYILGDFFEVWVGDDVLDDAHYGAEFLPVVAALNTLSKNGTRIYLMHGNRDFLLGEEFAQRCGAQLLADPARLEYGDMNIVLSHGDALCTDDVAYQQFRAQVRQPAWQQMFLSQPLAQRIAYANQARTQSQQTKTMHANHTHKNKTHENQTIDIMDVNPDAVKQLIRAQNYPQILLHGHTHRPAIHALEVDGHPCQRYVLGDWHSHATHTQAVVVKLAHGEIQINTLQL